MTFPIPQKSVNLLRNLERSVDEAFAELIHEPWRGAAARTALSAGWQPAIEVRETAEEFLVFVDLPGVTPEEVNVHLEEQTVVIHGKRALTRTAQAGAMIYTERVQGEFVRRVPLPGLVDRSRLQHSFSQGLLMVRLPKRRATFASEPEGGGDIQGAGI